MVGYCGEESQPMWQSSLYSTEVQSGYGRFLPANDLLQKAGRSGERACQWRTRPIQPLVSQIDKGRENQKQTR